ncbi:MAG: DUF1013 domain-containing protein [Alphaproteobacteria bacterium]|nr:DUF1013 domain-containing protein [Alphaproteobacteria bacterium]MBU0798258.1 DUF1013 domain-containing protein [Alphaproteobacteria bacterium]MBU0889020.1 DUF1013 domain-containing protein [Alphaproteobacteria bacterium]MBU1814040.1 DUF1013 domain-containing protein [Alphaproteobacteria bacterium]MBU2089082.1 DUF1013 domain-containing protein [Alphaproteobacteria bacterium]
MADLLMPKATAVWLVENTALSFEQIADFCGLHALEVQAIADGEVATGMQGLDPVANGQLTWAEIERCAKDESLRLRAALRAVEVPVQKRKGPKYTPISKRQDKPDAIAYLVRNHPELSDAQIGKLLGTTKPTIQSVRDKSHWNSTNIRPQHPVQLGLTSMKDMNAALIAARSRRPAEPVVEPDLSDGYDPSKDTGHTEPHEM